MKPTAYLINTGRAGLIDQDALERALAERKIAGAGLDVFPNEPLPAESKLRELDNVTLTTHIAGTTTEALTNSPFLLMEDIARLFRDGTPRFLVNPEVLDRPECAMWLQQHAPDVLRACSRLLGVQDYVAYLMTGSYCTDYSQASRTLLFDINGLRWDCEILRELEVPLNKLPDAVEPGARIGATTAALRRETGFPSGVPVVLAGGDQQLAAVGMGIVDPGTAVANTDTGSFLITPVERPVFHPEMRTLCSAAGAPGKWMAEAGILTTGIVYQWFAREIGSGRGAGDGPGDADQSDVQKADMERLNEIASQSPVGSNGVVVLPHFAGAAAPFWNADARGIIANIGLSTTRSDMARAVLESIAMELGMNFDLLVEQCGDISEVAVAGGLTRIALFNQMQADSFDTPVRLSAVPGASAFGAMISATVNLGVYPDHLQAYQSLSGHSEEYVFPDEAGRRALQDNKDLRRELHDTLESGGIYRRMRTLRAE